MSFPFCSLECQVYEYVEDCAKRAADNWNELDLGVVFQYVEMKQEQDATFIITHGASYLLPELFMNRYRPVGAFREAFFGSRQPAGSFRGVRKF